MSKLCQSWKSQERKTGSGNPRSPLLNCYELQLQNARNEKGLVKKITPIQTSMDSASWERHWLPDCSFSSEPGKCQLKVICRCSSGQTQWPVPMKSSGSQVLEYCSSLRKLSELKTCVQKIYILANASVTNSPRACYMLLPIYIHWTTGLGKAITSIYQLFLTHKEAKLYKLNLCLMYKSHCEHCHHPKSKGSRACSPELILGFWRQSRAQYLIELLKIM